MDRLYRDCPICGSKAKECLDLGDYEYRSASVWIRCSGCGLLASPPKFLRHGYTEQEKEDAYVISMLLWNDLNPAKEIERSLKYKEGKADEYKTKLEKLSRVVYSLFNIRDIHETDNWTISSFIDKLIKKHYVEKKEKNA